MGDTLSTTTTGLTFPPGYSDHAFNDICEVEVYGCPTPGYYGEDCSLPCPQNCQEGHCHIVGGTCLGCVPGYIGPTCDKKCSGSKFGLDCNESCGHCLEREQCHNVNGASPSGCDSGYQGIDCKQVCINNTYGPKCSLECGNCLYLYEEQCHHVTGQCPRGCDIGFQGDRCDQNSPTSDQMSTCQSSTPFYTSLALLIFSGLMNVFLVLRQLRNRRCSTKKNAGNTDKHQGRINRKLEQATSLPMSASNHYENDPEETKQEPPYDELQ
nr:multiple epidermal growth factor-like domains protein 10 [Crassostrea gigas]